VANSKTTRVAIYARVSTKDQHCTIKSMFSRSGVSARATASQRSTPTPASAAASAETSALVSMLR
jgi:hypothetical protein